MTRSKILGFTVWNIYIEFSAFYFSAITELRNLLKFLQEFIQQKFYIKSIKKSFKNKLEPDEFSIEKFYKILTKILENGIPQ